MGEAELRLVLQLEGEPTAVRPCRLPVEGRPAAQEP